jgi:hypothetical protein
MYNLPYSYAYALSDMRRITLILMHILMHVLLHILMHILMHILIQPPSSYKTSNGAETHDPSTHATAFMRVSADCWAKWCFYILSALPCV